MTAENEDAAGTAGPVTSASSPASTRERFATLYSAELAERILNEVQPDDFWPALGPKLPQQTAKLGESVGRVRGCPAS
jgi:hypothetical protein